MVSYNPFLGIVCTLPDFLLCFEVWETSFAGLPPRTQPRPTRGPMCCKIQLFLLHNPNVTVQLILQVLEAPTTSTTMRRRKLSNQAD